MSIRHPRRRGSDGLKKEQKYIKFEQMKLAKFCREKKILKMTSFSTFLKKLVVNQSRIKIRILMAFKGGFLTESRVFLYLADSPKHWPKKGKIFPLMK